MTVYPAVPALLKNEPNAKDASFNVIERYRNPLVRENNAKIEIMRYNEKKIFIIQVLISFSTSLLLLTSIPNAHCLSKNQIIDLTLQCKKCHNSIYHQWEKSMHAGSAQDRWVISMYNGSDIPGISLGPSYKANFPESPGNCSACHAPDYALEKPLETDLNEVQDSLGVSCLFCHFVERVDLYRDGSHPGTLSQHLKNLSQIKENITGCLIPRSSLVSKSLICASCHFGKYYDTLVYPSYGEWEKSNTKKNCQGCHFEKRTHRLKIDEKFFSKAIDLQMNARIENHSLYIDMAISNTGAGHFFPTGHPIRNMLFTIKASEPNGKTLSLTEGARIPLYGGKKTNTHDENNYSGLPGKGFARVLEKVSPISCFNVSVPTPNALLGQSLALEKETRELFPQEYWKRTLVFEDSRIPPLGAFKETYKFEIKEGIKKIIIEARLIYRKAFKPLADVYNWDLDDLIIKKLSQEITIKE